MFDIYCILPFRRKLQNNIPSSGPSVHISLSLQHCWLLLLKNFSKLIRLKCIYFYICPYLSMIIFSYICLLLACKGYYLNVQMNVKLFVLNAEYKKEICWLAFLHLLSSLYFSQPLLYRISLNFWSSHI